MSGSGRETMEALTSDPGALVDRPEPGAVLLFSGERAVHGVLGVVGGAVELGRDTLSPFEVSDGRMSRRHTVCTWNDGEWTVRDLDSRNGTVVDGESVTEARCPASAVVRIGSTLVLLCADVGPHRRHTVAVEDGVVVGAALASVLEVIRRSAPDGVLHVRGPSGAGKEIAARAFHRHGPRPDAAFVALNCAAIPEGVAERLLFGAQRGAYSGAADATGHIRDAHGGTLFLDEIGDLDLAVQAKLLRVLETREVIPLGASRGQRVDLRLVSATHRDLRAAVADKRFREDLYYRIGRPDVTVPALRERREEIPLLVERELRAHRLVPHVSLVEAALLRAWPGNVRELLTEIRAAARAAASNGEERVRASDLPAGAGTTIETDPPPDPDGPRALPSREQIEEALRASEGKVATAARLLGVHRNQLRRWIAKERPGSDPDE